MVQSRLPNEIIIADDGSRSETRKFIDTFKPASPIPVIHVWQPDEGYQLAKIRNKAFTAATTEYLIQIDGDLILHRHFISDHLRMCRENIFVSGSRVHMDQTLTDRIISGSVALDNIKKETAHLNKKHNGFHSNFLCQANFMLQRGRSSYKHVLGCNMAFWKKDLEKVNGYNESFKGWGKEDNDLAVRLKNAGVKLRFIKYGAIVYHLAHTVADLSSIPANEQALEKSIKEKMTFVPLGMRHPPGAGSGDQGASSASVI